MFLMVKTRLNITFAILIASQYAKNLSHKHTKAMKTILSYITGSKYYGITYDGQQKLFIKGYFNSDWAKDLKSQKSTIAFILILNSDLVSWCSKRQL